MVALSVRYRSTMLKVRSAAIDAVRVVGIVAVVAGHVWSNGTARELLYTWHVPVFFFLSGYLWAPGRTLGAEFRNRWRTLGRPYLAWLVVIGAVFLGWLALRGQLTPTMPLRLLMGGDYIGRPFSAFWFMSALFAACVIFRALDRWPWLVAGLGACGLVAAAAVPDLIAEIPLSVGISVPALIFMVAGFAFRRVRNRIARLVPLAFGALVLSAVVVALGWSAPLDMKRADFGTPGLSVLVSILICAGLLVLAEALIPMLGIAVGRTIVALATCGTMVILTHAAILWLLNAPADGSVIDFLLALLVPWLAAFVTARTPLAPVLIGVSPASWRYRAVPTM